MTKREDALKEIDGLLNNLKEASERIPKDPILVLTRYCKIDGFLGALKITDIISHEEFWEYRKKADELFFDKK